MGYQYRLLEYYKVKQDKVYPWPCSLDKNRTLEIFTDDVLSRQKDGTYVCHTGIMKVDIHIPDDDVELIKTPTMLEVI